MYVEVSNVFITLVWRVGKVVKHNYIIIIIM